MEQRVQDGDLDIPYYFLNLLAALAAARMRGLAHMPWRGHALPDTCSVSPAPRQLDTRE
jgi:hypothetical protein